MLDGICYELFRALEREHIKLRGQAEGSFSFSIDRLIVRDWGCLPNLATAPADVANMFLTHVYTLCNTTQPSQSAILELAGARSARWRGLFVFSRPITSQQLARSFQSRHRDLFLVRPKNSARHICAAL